MDDRDPTSVLGLAFSLSSVAGLAALLRSNQQLTTRAVFSAFLNSGLTGGVIGAIWWNWYGGSGHPWFMLGVSTLAGLGGPVFLDFILQLSQDSLKDWAKAVVTRYSTMPIQPPEKSDNPKGS